VNIAPILPPAILVPTMVALAGWAIIDAVRGRHRRRGIVLSCLRAAAMFALGACLIRPLVAEKEAVSRDVPPGPRRQRAFVLAERGCADLPVEYRSRIAGLERACIAKRFDFGGPEVGETDGERPPAQTPGIGNALGIEDALAPALAACGSRPDAALLLLDGARGEGDYAPVAWRLVRGGVRVFAVRSRTSARPHVALGPLDIAPAEPKEGRPAVASAELVGHAPGCADVPVRWTLDGVEFATRRVRTPSREGPVRVESAFVVPSAGLHRVRVQVGPLEGEVDVGDNSSAAFFRARPGPLRVLVVEGAPRPAYRALRRALVGDDRFAASATCSAERPPRGRLLPRDGSDWSALDVVVLGDLAAPDFAPGDLKRLSRFVREGGGLVVVAGPRNLGPGDWGRTALAPILPVKVARDDAAVPGPLDVRPAGRAGTPRPFPFGAGLLGDIGTAVADRTETRRRSAGWRELPEVERARAVTGIAPGAGVPVIAVRPGREVPMLVHGDAGDGRVVVVLSDDLPRWVAAGSGGRIAHDEFWRDVVAGAGRFAPDGANRVWLEPPTRAAVAGKPLRLDAYFADAAAAGSIRLEYRGAMGGRRLETLALAPRGLVRTFEVVPPGEGRLTLRAFARSVKREVGSAPVDVAVVANSGDGGRGATERPATDSVDPADAGHVEVRLRAACRASGGRLSTPDRPGQAVEGFIAATARTQRAAPTRVTRRDAVPPPALLALFVLLLVADWALRRAWGME